MGRFPRRDMGYNADNLQEEDEMWSTLGYRMLGFADDDLFFFSMKNPLYLGNWEYDGIFFHVLGLPNIQECTVDHTLFCVLKSDFGGSVGGKLWINPHPHHNPHILKSQNNSTGFPVFFCNHRWVYPYSFYDYDWTWLNLIFCLLFFGFNTHINPMFWSSFLSTPSAIRFTSLQSRTRRMTMTP